MPTTKLAEWSRKVKSRDGKCLHCGTTEDLHAHHKIRKSERPDLALDPENGVTLCYRCHKREHARDAPFRMPKSKRPHRKTLELRIAQLEKKNTSLSSEIRRLKGIIREQERGIYRFDERNSS